jgi:hypothetical protein
VHAVIYTYDLLLDCIALVYSIKGHSFGYSRHSLLRQLRLESGGAAYLSVLELQQEIGAATGILLICASTIPRE